MKDKDLLGIPWMVAFALRADGWWLRQDIIWHKPNPMPESVTDRCTKAHEYVFLLTKSARYFYDAAAIAEDAIHAGQEVTLGEKSLSRGQASGAGVKASGNGLAASVTVGATRNARSVWPIATQPYSGAHFATMPPALAERCIKAGSKPGDMVLDPFGGAGTTGLVADRLGRSATLIELNPEYARLARERITADAPLFGAQ
jgi:DNA modification methylase